MHATRAVEEGVVPGVVALIRTQKTLEKLEGVGLKNRLKMAEGGSGVER